MQPPWALSMYRYGQAAFGVSATQGDRRGRPAEGGQSHQIAMTNAGRGVRKRRVAVIPLGVASMHRRPPSLYNQNKYPSPPFAADEVQPSVTSGGLRATGAMGNCAGTLCKESCKGGCCGVRCACSCKVEMEDEELEVETPTVDASGTVDVPSITADRAAYGGEVGGPAVDVSLPSVEATDLSYGSSRVSTSGLSAAPPRAP